MVKLKSETRTISNPLSPDADTANWSEWSEWTPVYDTDSSVIILSQTRSRNCLITVNSLEDNPAPLCSGSSYSSETQTRDITNPLAADTITFGAWGQLVASS